MRNTLRTTVAVAAFAAAMTAASSASAIALRTSQDFGKPADGTFVDRVITITPDMHPIGVFRNRDGEIYRRVDRTKFRLAL